MQAIKYTDYKNPELMSKIEIINASEDFSEALSYVQKINKIKPEDCNYYELGERFKKITKENYEIFTAIIEEVTYLFTRDSIFSLVARKLKETDEGLKAALLIGDAEHKEYTLKKMCAKLIKTKDCNNWTRAITAASNIENHQNKSKALAKITQKLFSKEEYFYAIHAFKKMEHGIEEHQALRNLVEKNCKKEKKYIPASTTLGQFMTDFQKNNGTKEMDSAHCQLFENFKVGTNPLNPIDHLLAKMIMKLSIFGHLDELMFVKNAIESPSFKESMVAPAATELARHGFVNKAQNLMQDRPIPPNLQSIIKQNGRFEKVKKGV